MGASLDIRERSAQRSLMLNSDIGPQAVIPLSVRMLLASALFLCSCSSEEPSIGTEVQPSLLIGGDAGASGQDASNSAPPPAESQGFEAAMEPLPASTGEELVTVESPPPIVRRSSAAEKALLIGARNAQIAAESTPYLWLGRFSFNATSTAVQARFLANLESGAGGSLHLSRWLVVEHLGGRAIESEFVLAQHALDGRLPTCNAIDGSAESENIFLLRRRDDARYEMLHDGAGRLAQFIPVDDQSVSVAGGARLSKSALLEEITK